MPEKVYVKNPDLVFRKVAGEYILVPIRRKIGDLESIYTLNELSSKIWELINGKRTVKDIISIIIKEFDVAIEEAAKDILQLLSQMEQIEAIQAVTKPQHK